ncbi:MAG TPA: hypothetical protein EYP68_06965 [Candidatus Korarchaeota archaeon]|nr:hypothetical protein [Candidatus Korarchaeota archaeon]
MDLDFDQILHHYRESFVINEIADFCKKRWISLFGKRVLRYDVRGTPLRILGPAQVSDLLERYSFIEPRSFYATSALYKELERRECVDDESNVLTYTPYWDIDNDPEKWRATVEIVQEILDLLEREGIHESAYIMWTGRGMHVNIHQGSISPEIVKKHGALNVAWAVVEYIKGKLLGKLHDIREKHDSFKLRVDNEIKPKNLFSVPLSLHRQVNSVVVCIKPDDLCCFDPSWSNPGCYRHSKEWRRFSPGESDYLVEKAIQLYGGYPYPLRSTRYRRKEPRVEDMIRKWLQKR